MDQFELKRRCIWNDFKKNPPEPLQLILSWVLIPIKEGPSLSCSPVIIQYIPEKTVRYSDRPNFEVFFHCRDMSENGWIPKGWWRYFEMAQVFKYCNMKSLTDHDMKCWLPLPTDILIQGIDDD